MTHHALLYALAVLLVLIGLIGVVLPALPGLPFVFAGMLLAAWADGFREIGWVTLVILGLMTAVSFVVDFWATAHGAKRWGASKYAVWGAVLGTFAGLFIMPPLGLFVGPFLGALIGELIHGQGNPQGGAGRLRHVAGHRVRDRAEARAGLRDDRGVRVRVVLLAPGGPFTPRVRPLP